MSPAHWGRDWVLSAVRSLVSLACSFASASACLKAATRACSNASVFGAELMLSCSSDMPSGERHVAEAGIAFQFGPGRT